MTKYPNTYTFVSQQATIRTITTIEEAKDVIKATATVREFSHEEVVKDEQLTNVAASFGIDLNDLIVEKSPTFDDFYYTYRFRGE